MLWGQSIFSMKIYSLELLPQYTKLKDENSHFFSTFKLINVNLHFKLDHVGHVGSVKIFSVKHCIFQRTRVLGMSINLVSMLKDVSAKFLMYFFSFFPFHIIFLMLQLFMYSFHPDPFSYNIFKLL